MVAEEAEIMAQLVEAIEGIAEAFARILETETGLNLPFDQARLLGAYEHLYDDNRFGEPGYGTHYVVLGMELQKSVFIRKVVCKGFL